MLPVRVRRSCKSFNAVIMLQKETGLMKILIVDDAAVNLYIWR